MSDAAPTTVEAFEKGRFDVESLAPDERRFLLKAVDALYASGLTDEEEEMYELVVDQLRWIHAGPLSYCVDEQWVAHRATGEQIDPPKGTDDGD